MFLPNLQYDTVVSPLYSQHQQACGQCLHVTVGLLTATVEAESVTSVLVTHMSTIILCCH